MLLVAGDGKLLPEVQRAEVVDGSKVRSYGRLGREDAQQLLASAAVSLSPQGRDWDGNKWGASPIKVAESLVLGVPVVVSDVNASTAIVSGESLGEVHEADNADDLALKVSQVLPMGVQTRERDRISKVGAAHFTWESVAKRTADIVRASASVK